MGTFRPTSWSTQEGFSFRFDWGVEGLDAIGVDCGAVIVVDVLRFCTAASIVVEHGGTVELAASTEASALRGADVRAAVEVAPSSRVHLWSLNGHRIATRAIQKGFATFAGCLRNASATAAAASVAADGSPIAVIAAGERWPGDSIRVATEDLLGAGAVLNALDPYGALAEPCCSPAARAARASFIDAAPVILDMLTATASGRELWERGDGDDVRDASRIDVADMPCLLSR